MCCWGLGISFEGIVRIPHRFRPPKQHGYHFVQHILRVALWFSPLAHLVGEGLGVRVLAKDRALFPTLSLTLSH